MKLERTGQVKVTEDIKITEDIKTTNTENEELDKKKNICYRIPGTEIVLKNYDNGNITVSQRGSCPADIPIEEIEKIAKLPELDAYSEIRNRFQNRNHRPAINKIVKLQREGSVDIREIINQNFEKQVIEPKPQAQPEPQQEQTGPLLEITANKNEMEKPEKKKRFWPIPGDRTVSYCQLEKDELSLSYDGETIETSWPEIIRLSSLGETQRAEEIIKIYPSNPEKRIAIKSFILAYQEERVRDPDAFCRPILVTDTKVNENFGKVEMNLGM